MNTLIANIIAEIKESVLGVWCDPPTYCVVCDADFYPSAEQPDIELCGHCARSRVLPELEAVQ